MGESVRTVHWTQKKCSMGLLALKTQGLREDMSQIFLSRQTGRQCWGNAMCRVLMRAALGLCFLLPPFSNLSSTCDSSPWRRDRSACRTQILTCLPCQCSKIYESLKLYCKMSWLSDVEPDHSAYPCRLHCGLFSSLMHKTKGITA